MRIFASLQRLLSSVQAGGRTSLAALIDAIRSLFGADEETSRRVAFSVAIIALSAKMAKADGIVSSNEVRAFREILEIPPDELRNVFRLYDIAKQDTAGFEAYAGKIRNLCWGGEGENQLLIDVLDGLFHIAKADGIVHERELAFLSDVAEVFGLDAIGFRQLRDRHLRGPDDPYAVLGLDPQTPRPKARKRYLELVRENHPDRLAARGVPDEFMFIANERMKAINRAYDQIAGKTAA